MSPRPKRLRKMSGLPLISGLKPYGGEAGRGKVFLHLEEYEAIRLCDYEMMNHLNASRAMNISRPTLTRIYTAARRKIAQAMVEGKQIIIEGGKIYFDSEWYGCSGCGCYFNLPATSSNPNNCPLCGSIEIENLDNDSNQADEPGKMPDICFCPKCGYSQSHQKGQPCRATACSRYGSKMIRRLHNNI
jgi:uncharacterized protein